MNETLADIGDIQSLMEDFSQQMAFRQAMGIPVDRGFIEIVVREAAHVHAARPSP